VGKTALIVDDSRSARIVLKKMLETHELRVDMAESAEDALDYLCDHRPDVIFMDHLMPGMDGFQAVSAIKNNPVTATIPIMMYTSQEGEVYVGQARALGAVGVLPKKVEPVEVSKVLKSLRVIDADRDAQLQGAAPTVSTGSSGEYPGLETLDQDLRILIKDLFEQQRALLRRDILTSHEAIVSRVVDEIRPVPNGDEILTGADKATGHSFIMRGMVSVLIVAVVIFAWLFWKREEAWQALESQNALLQQEVQDRRTEDAENAQLDRQALGQYQRSLGEMFSAVIAGLEWGANQAALYDFGELPLGEDRLAVIEQLSDQLAVIDFSGLIRIETHVADFCLYAAGTDGYELAPGNVSAIRCDRIGWAPGEAYELGLRQSVSFANFIRLADERYAGRIRYDIVSLGNSDPILDYPISPESVSAATWNGIAARNNRVEISVFPNGL
jgi:CheY-like chemotaxis protein